MIITTTTYIYKELEFVTQHYHYWPTELPPAWQTKPAREGQMHREANNLIFLYYQSVSISGGGEGELYFEYWLYYTALRGFIALRRLRLREARVGHG